MDKIKLLEKHGWYVECDNPFSIRHSQSGSYLSGPYAYSLVHDLNNLEQEKDEETVTYRVATQLKEDGTGIETLADDILVLTRGCSVNEHIQMIYGGRYDIINIYTIEIDNVHISKNYLRAQAQKLISFK